MRTWFGKMAILAIVLFGLTACYYQVVPNFNSLQKQVDPSTVTIHLTVEVPDDPIPFRIKIQQHTEGINLYNTGVGNGTGSGYFVSSNGYIMTNYHVVNAEGLKVLSLTVKLNDGKEYNAIVVAVDVDNDLALIRISGKNYPHVKFGNSDNVSPGDWVMAIGAPFNFENSVTEGIVSKVNVKLPDGNVKFIQSNCTINPGNSGGALFNMNGEVIGMNARIYSRSGGFEGISFSIPSNTIKDFIKKSKVKF